MAARLRSSSDSAGSIHKRYQARLPLMSTLRKPARRMAEIPPNVLAALNRGETETLNLVEWLATDQRVLARQVFRTLGLSGALDGVLVAVEKLDKPTAMQQTRAIGLALADV